jgi:acyl-homoserine lactone acylase PvdQ
VTLPRITDPSLRGPNRALRDRSSRLVTAGLVTSSSLASAEPQLAATPRGITAAAGDYRATIQRTAGGVAHITAKDFGSLGFGFGDAFASDDICTMAGLNTADHAVRTAFGDALVQMKQAHLPFNVELGKVQYVLRHGHRIPLHGGPGDPDGDFNAIYQNVFTGRGQAPDIGSSYIQVVTWHSAHGCPDVARMLTYSQSSNPNSKWYADQTKRYSKKKWEIERFCRAAVRKHALSTVTVHGPRSA